MLWVLAVRYWSFCVLCLSGRGCISAATLAVGKITRQDMLRRRSVWRIYLLVSLVGRYVLILKLA